MVSVSPVKRSTPRAPGRVMQSRNARLVSTRSLTFLGCFGPITRRLKSPRCVRWMEFWWCLVDPSFCCFPAPVLMQTKRERVYRIVKSNTNPLMRSKEFVFVNLKKNVNSFFSLEKKIHEKISIIYATLFGRRRLNHHDAGCEHRWCGWCSNSKGYF